jgi:hypothetical protein
LFRRVFLERGSGSYVIHFVLLNEPHFSGFSDVRFHIVAVMHQVDAFLYVFRQRKQFGKGRVDDAGPLELAFVEDNAAFSVVVGMLDERAVELHVGGIKNVAVDKQRIARL